MMTQDQRSKGNILKQVLGFIGMVVMISIVVLVVTENKRSQENPFDLQLDGFSEIDPNLVKYELSQRIPISCIRLYGVAVDGSDFIYASTEKRIIKFNQYGSEIMSFSVPEPIRTLTIAANGDIYAASAQKLYRYDPAGDLEVALISLEGSSMITSIDITENDIFIADAGQRIVLHYDKSGTLINHIGGKQTKQGRPGFIIPSPFFDLAVDPRGFLWVVNPGMHTFEKYTFDGQLIQEWGRFSAEIDGFCGCCNPSHFALVPGKGFVTSEKGLVRVKMYSAEGQFESVVAGPDDFQKQATGLDLRVDSNQRIVIADPSSKMIKIFSRMAEQS